MEHGSNSYDSLVRIWDTSTGEIEHVLEDHSDDVKSLAFSSDGGIVVSGSRKRSALIWSSIDGKWK